MVNMVAAYDGKFTYTASVLDIDEHKLHSGLLECLSQSFNVSCNASFPTSQNISALLTSAFSQGRNMAINGHVYSAVSADVLLTQAVLLGSTLSGKVGNLESQSNAAPAASAGAAPNEKQAGAGASTAPAAEKK